LKELRPTLGLELELPFSGGRLTGFNLGAQYTLGDAFGGRFILKTLSFLRLFRQELAGQWIVPELALLTVGDVFDLLHAVLELGLDDWCVVHRFESAENFR
jgi:hypothetical protein